MEDWDRDHRPANGAEKGSAGVRVRFLLLVVGGLFLFRGATSVGATKILYGGIASLAFAVSLLRLINLRGTEARAYKRLVGTTVFVLGYLATTALFAHGNGATLSNWFRDVLPYMILVAAPLIGIDAGRVFTTRQLDRIIIPVGLFAVIAFTVQLSTARSLANSGTRLGLASIAMCCGFFAFALGKAAGGIAGRARLAWLIACFGVPAAMLSTGTRGSVIVLAAFFGALGSPSRKRIPPLKGLLVLGVGLVLGGVLLSVFARYTFNDPQFVQRRVQSAVAVVRDPTARQADLSFQDRQRQYDLASEQLREHPVIGTGPGYLYPFAGPMGTTVTTFTLDTPTSTLAKFGAIGSLVIALFCLQVGFAVGRVRRTTGPLPIMTIGRAFVFVFVAYIPLGSFFEDKGLPIAVMLFMAYIESTRRAVLVQQAGQAPPAAREPVRRVAPSRAGNWTRVPVASKA